MDSEPAVLATDDSRVPEPDTAAGKLAQTRARCKAALAAADASVRRSQAALALAEERLRHAQETQRTIQERRARWDTGRAPASSHVLWVKREAE